MTMTSLSDVLNIASDGLSAQTAGMAATGQNVANVNTPGYSRVSANIESTQTGDTFAGSVQVSGVVRSYDQFTFGNLLTQQGMGGAADARSEALNTAQATVAPSSGGTIADSVNSFFSSLTTLESSPSDTSAREGVLQSAQNLAQTISTTAAGLTSQRSALLQQAQGVATSLNGELQQIATLNGQIAQATAQGSQPTDLQDQRDSLISQVSGQIGGQVVEEPSGITLLAAGTALVTGTQASTVSVGLDTSGNLQILASQSGGASMDITSNTNSGSLGGIREARDTDIPSFSGQLDQFAYNLATSVNAVQSSGYGLDGATGRNLFTQPTTVAGAAAAFAVDPTVAGQPQMIAASSTAAGVPGGNDVAVQLASLATQPLGGGEPPAQAFGAIASSVGDATSAASSDSQLRDDTVTQAQDLNSSSSGVSLNEEMTNMTQFQNAYDASAKVLQTAESLLSDLMTDINAVTG
jgi:flagellar hook-associated protein 1 FlgK